MSFTILTGELSHETNVFSVKKADYQAFANGHVYLGQAAIAARGDANTGLAGFLDVASQEQSTVIHSLSAAAGPCGAVTTDAFDRLVGTMVAAAERDKARIDGVLLALHGAMVTEAHEDGEGETLARLRAVLKPGTPIGITLDLHANVTERMCELADIIVSYKTYPHVDMRIAGRHAATVLHRAMRGEISPRTIRVHVPMLEETNGCRTDLGPMIDWVAKARAYEEDPDVFAVSINGGFAHADIREVGPTVLVTGQGDMQRHRRFAETIAVDMWEKRALVLNRYLTVDETVEIARGYETHGKGPLVIADYSDNPGAGAYGDSTALLRGLIDRKVEEACFGPMVDPDSAALLHRHKIGDTVSLKLGGKTDPTIGGAPLDVTGRLVGLFDGWYTGDGPMIGGLRFSFGPTAVLKLGGISVLVVSVASQMRDLQQFKAFGIDPAEHRIVALKSQQHFRAAFEPIASQVIVCDAGALSTTELTHLPFENVPRPIYPLDPTMSWKP
jgi:microcystin degradation protein MlrC